jgi:hypothetical protein
MDILYHNINGYANKIDLTPNRLISERGDAYCQDTFLLMPDPAALDSAFRNPHLERPTFFMDDTK